MQTLFETNDLARAINRSEQWTRRAINRGDIAPFARTARGTALFRDTDIASVRERIASPEATNTRAAA